MALGRGLEDILSDVGVDLKEEDIIEIEIDKIKLNPNQPRKEFNEEKIKELANSIKDYGLIQPIAVISDNDYYILVSGERRLRAVKSLGWDKIKAIILDIDKKKLREVALIENIQRENLNVIELALSYEELIKEYNLTHEELAKMLSKSRTSITNTLRLLNLTPYTKDKIIQNKITPGHAKVLVGLDSKFEKEIVDRIIDEKLSVRETEEIIKSYKKNENFDINRLNLVVDRLKKDNLEAKIDKGYFKIKINSDIDIEKILKYF